VSLPSPNLNVSWVKYRHLKGLTQEGEGRESRGGAGSSSPWSPPTLVLFLANPNHGKECKSSLTQLRIKSGQQSATKRIKFHNSYNFHSLESRCI